jgi:hypothetical protein
MNDFTDPLERLEQRALDGLRFGIAALKRLRHTLPKWMRRDNQLDPAKAIAAVAAVNSALATMSPLNMQRLARRIRRGKAA